MKTVRASYLLLMALLVAGIFSVAHAEDLMMVRSKQDFPDTMTTLQESILAHGYSLTRVQRVDIGLTGSGYQTDKYRVVFFAKHKEVERLLELEPEIAAYLPLKFSMFAEESQTLVLATNPVVLAKYFTGPEVVTMLRRWESDFRSILDDVRRER